MKSMRKTFNLKFNFGEQVFLKSDPDRKMRVISGYLIRKNQRQYLLGYGTDETSHDESEITSFRTNIFKVRGFVG